MMAEGSGRAATIAATGTLARLLRPILLARARVIASRVATAIEPGESVLDVGCGDMLIGHETVKRVGVRWVGVETIAYPSAGLPCEIYDGRHLPFPDAGFDVVLLAFVLHHAREPDLLLDEAVRVARRRIIVLEDAPATRVQRFVARAHDFAVNRLLSAEMDLPYGFRSDKEWTSAYRSRGLRVTSSEEVRTQSLAIIRQSFYVLDKPSS